MQLEKFFLGAISRYAFQVLAQKKRAAGFPLLSGLGLVAEGVDDNTKAQVKMKTPKENRGALFLIGFANKLPCL